MQGGKNWILTKDTNETGSSETLIGWKSRKTADIPLRDRMEGVWLWTPAGNLSESTHDYKNFPLECI